MSLVAKLVAKSKKCFLAPTGAQGVTICVCLTQVCQKHLIFMLLANIYKLYFSHELQESVNHKIFYPKLHIFLKIFSLKVVLPIT